MVLSSLICVYIASADLISDIGSYDSVSIIIYSILAILCTVFSLSANLHSSALGFRESHIDLKDAIMKHSSGIIDDETLLKIYNKCEEKITKSVFKGC